MMIAASRHTGVVARRRMAVSLTPAIAVAPHRHHQRCLLAARAGKDDKSWGEIAAEAADVVKSVAAKVAGGASAALQRISQPKQPVRQQQHQQQQPGDVFGGRGGRPLPMPLPGGGLLGSLVGGLVNSTLKGLADQLEQSAAQSRGLADRAAARIQGSARVKQRLGEVTVGLPLSQSSSTTSINGRRSTSVSLVLPLFNAVGAPLAQASVSAVEGPGQDGSSCRIAIRMPTGDKLVLDDDDDDVGSQPRSKVGASSPQGGGEVIDAEFRDLN